MGVMGWPPSVVMQESTIDELADTYEGYSRFHGLWQESVQRPSAEFLNEMVKKFPDRGGDNEQSSGESVKSYVDDKKGALSA